MSENENSNEPVPELPGDFWKNLDRKDQSLPGMNPLVQPFFDESEALFSEIEDQCMYLYDNPADENAITALQTAFQTIYSNAQLIKKQELQQLAESALTHFKNMQSGAIETGPDAVEVVLECLDLVREIIEALLNGLPVSTDISPVMHNFGELDPQNHTPYTKAKKPPREPLAFEPALQKIVNEFIAETIEILDETEEDLLKLEMEPENSETVHKLFRSLHTIKGNSKGLGFKQLNQLAHRTEDVIRSVAEGAAKVRTEHISAVFQSLDLIKGMVREIENGYIEERDLSPLLTQLDFIAGQKFEALKAWQAEHGNTNPLEITAQKTKTSTIRVNLDKLDNLINTAGELVLAKNRIRDLVGRIEEGRETGNVEAFLESFSARLGILTSDLQADVMAVRLQPIGKVFNKYHRVIRDIASETGKEIHLHISGAETELDNGIVEEIGDPLIHMIRNACDHGIEGPEIRKAAGKPQEGHVYLNACQEGNFIIIEIRDDGKGLDSQAIKAKAVSKKLISQASADILSPGDTLNLIFKPGFSTAEQTTELSGRGVGMDVVKTSIAKFNGIIDIDSEIGKGTEFRIRLPLTMAVLYGLDVMAGEEKYIIPQEGIIEILPLSLSEAEKIYKEKSYFYRSRHVIGVTDLAEYLSCPAGPPKNKKYMVIIGRAEKLGGVLVDDILQREEVVIKPLGRFIEHFSVKEMCGATITGDGRVKYILNNQHLIHHQRAPATS